MLRRVIASTLLFAAASLGAADKAPLPATIVADRAKPATVLLVTRASVAGSCPRADLDAGKLKQRMVEMVAEGKLHQFMSESEIGLAVLNEVLASPEIYLALGDESRTFQTPLSYSGSGFLVTPDGYIVTNAHVVQTDDDDIARALAANLAEWVKEDINQLDRRIGNVAPGQAMTDRAKARFRDALARFYIVNMERETSEKKVYAVLGYWRPGQNIDVVGKLCDIKAMGQAAPGKDVAVLKIPGRNYPTLPLLDSTAAERIRTGEELHAVGFPGVATFTDTLSVSSQLEPTMTNGRVSALKTMADGWRIVQTDAPLAPGNSGGPVLNEFGEVVGVATFSSTDPTTGQQVQGFNFVVPVEVVREFLREANVTPAESAFTAKYNAALTEFQQRYYSDALVLFRAAGEQSPGLPYIQEYLARCQEEISAGRDESWKKNLWILASGGGAIALLVALFLMRLLLRRRPSPVPRESSSW